ncbi:MAG: response regulator [Pseudomonadota bacterium]
MKPTSPRTDAPRILVVDDEREIRQILGEFLTAKGFHVSVVETGRQALDLCAEPDTRFDVALVDWTLPGIDGPDVMAQIRDTQPGCHILAITGHADQVVSASAVGTLVEEVFRKPFSLRDLSSRLSTILGRPPIATR